MRIGIVVFDYRTNTFAADSGTVPFRSIGDFDARSVLGLDPRAIPADSELIPLLILPPTAGGPLTPSSFDALLGSLDQAIQAHRPLDALVLIGSGITLADGSSGELALARFCRARYPDLLLGAYFDQTAQFPPDLLTLTPLVTGPLTWPSRDRPLRLVRLLSVLHAWHEGRIEPVALHLPVAALLPLAAQRTDCAPLDWLPTALSDLETEPNVLLVTLFAGFPYADVEFAGTRLVAVTYPRLGGTSERFSALADAFRRLLPRLAQPQLTIEEALHAAMRDSQHRTVILDTGDAPEAGAPGEGTAALWAALDLGSHATLIFGIVDPEAVVLAHSAGLGATVELELGGKRDHRHGYPIPVRGTVRGLRTEATTIESPRYPGLPIEAGPSAWLELEGRHEARVHVIVTSRPVPFADLRLARALGFDPDRASCIVAKSALDILLSEDVRRFENIVPALTPGITSADLAFFDFRNVPRPMWPLDEL